MTILPISPDPPPLRVPALILVLGLTFSSSCSPPPADPSVLRPGVPVVREIGGRGSHTYRLFLEPGQYLQVRIDQPGVDVDAKLVSPGGKAILFFDEPHPLDEPDRLAWISETGGEHRLLVAPSQPGSRTGRYRVVLRELRHADPGDTQRLDAERAYCEGRRVLGDDESEETRKRSLAQFERALSLWEAAGDRAGQADALIQIAEMRILLSDSASAIGPAHRALRLARKASYREGEGRALQTLGVTYQWIEDEPQALEFFEKALPLWEELEDDARRGAVLYAMGNSHSRQNRDDQAVELLERALPFFRAAGDLGQQSKALAASCAIQLTRGETSKALAHCQAARELSESSGDPSAEALALYTLGAIYQKRGEFELARRHFDQALAINLRLGNTGYVATTRQALGSAYFNLGDSERALAEYSSALQISREIEARELEARLLTNTGWIHYANGEREKALALFRQTLPLHETLGSKSGIALTLHNIGVAYTALKRPEDGLSFLRRALELRSILGERAAIAGSLLEIGTAYRALGDLDQADSFFRQGFDLAREVGNTNLQAECLFRWAGLNRERGELETALSRIEDSLGVIESVRSNVFSDKLRTTFFASKRAYYELYLDLLMQLEELQPGRFQGKAIEASERARSRGLLDLLAAGNINVEAGIDPALRQRELELGARLSLLQDELGKSAPEQAAPLERRLDQVQAEMEKLESEIRRQHHGYAGLRYPTPMKLEEIRNLLDDRTALVEYFVGAESSFLFVVTREGLSSYRLPSRPDLARKVDAMRRVLQARGRRSLPRYQDLAHQLYVQLLGPAKPILQSKDRLLIAPDGPLYLLPFEALLTGEEGGRTLSYGDLPYLIRACAVSYIPSASVLGEIRAARSAARSAGSPVRFLAFADPAYGTTGASRSTPPQRGERGLSRLTDSKAEVERIASLYPGSSAIYLGEEATEDNVKQNPTLGTALVIHFATHGIVDEIRPQLSGLELARIPGSKEDGTLQVYEIFNLRLKADLLTLSACETARGKEIRGEGVIGLTRAFLYAGAKSLLVSLWPVADRSTPDLMFGFYKNLSASDKAEALRRAKLAMIRSGEFSEPYYWAPFILAGESR